MAVFSIIKKSQLEGAHRLDAEYYQPEYLEAVEKIRSFSNGFRTIEDSNLAVVSGPFGSSLKSDAYLESGVPFLRISDLRDFFINKAELVYISEKDNSRLKQSQLFPNDIVLSKVGNTIGIVSAVPQEFKVCNISENNIGIKFKDKNLNKEYKNYLLAFLNSRFGFDQIFRRISGNAQPKLNVQDVYDIIYPLPSEEFSRQINNLVTESEILTNESNLFYSQAENLLLGELGLKDFESESELWNVVSLSEVKKANRADAEYFQPKYQKIIERVKSKEFSTLNDLSVFIGHATQTPYDEHGSIAVLAQKHMEKNLQIDFDRFDNFTSDNLIKKNDKKYILKKGDILISSAGEPGLASVWIDDYGTKKVIPGSFVTIARLKDSIEPLYLGVFLNTSAGKLQFERNYSGSVQQYVYPLKMKEILVPILPQTTQQKIADLVRKSHEARKKARRLLEEAKSKVEKLIENR